MGETKRNQTPVVIIMAGGSGTRFWPVSSKALPKQYLKLNSDRSLIQETVDRALKLTSKENIFISSGTNQLELIKKQIPEIKHTILEPSSKNTAACLMLSMSHLQKLGFPQETPVLVFPSDHCIQHTERFMEIMQRGLSFLNQHAALLTFGITPTFPHTGYGYIQGGKDFGSGIFKAERFLEKPNSELAQTFFQQGGYFWNSGIFAWTLDTITKAFETHSSSAWQSIGKVKTELELAQVFDRLNNEPIDKAILEKASNVFVLPSPSLGWSDLGSWGALHDLKSKDGNDNFCSSNQFFLKDVQGCFIQTPPGIKLGAIGLKNLIVVLTDDSLLILDKTQDQSVKDISQHFSRND